MGALAEEVLERTRDGFFAHREPVYEQKGETVAGVGSRMTTLQPLQHVLRECFGIHEVELLQVLQVPGDGAHTPGREADARNAGVATTRRTDLARLVQPTTCTPAKRRFISFPSTSKS